MSIVIAIFAGAAFCDIIRDVCVPWRRCGICQGLGCAFCWGSGRRLRFWARIFRPSLRKGRP